MEPKRNTGKLGKLTFTGSPDDFVEFIRFLEQTGGIINMDTGELATREDIATEVLKHVQVDLGGYPDYKTLELCSNGSDLREKILALMKKRREGDFSDMPTE